MNRNGFESLENRQMLTTLKGIDVNLIVNADTTKENGNTVILRFSSPMQSFDISKMRMFGYSNNTINGGQVKTTINIKSGTVNGNNINLVTDVSIRKGATIVLGTGAVTDTTSGGVSGSFRTTKGLNRDRFTLALRAFAPVNKTYFSSAILTGGSAPVTANTTPSAQTEGPLLSAFLAKKVAAGTITQATMDSTMARFSNAAVVALVPAANLRAAILSLVGTVGEPAIAFYLDKGNATGKDPIEVNFDGANFSSGGKINETTYTNSGKLKQVWNPNYAGESFVVLSGLIAHETVHEGTEGTGSTQVNSQQEEVVANTIEGIIYAQQIVNDFTYAQSHSTLTLRANYRELLMLNSGDNQFPRVGILTAPLVRRLNANPGFLATDYDTRTTNQGKPGEVSFTADVEQEFTSRNVAKRDATASYPTARAILHNITGDTYTSATTYGDALIKNIDLDQDTMGDAFVMRVARVLQVSV